jgi:hypothetical protein
MYISNERDHPAVDDAGHDRDDQNKAKQSRQIGPYERTL